MKRAIVLLSTVAICIAGLLSVRGAMPFMAVCGTSMRPVYQAGDLIWIKGIQPDEVDMGDIIVFRIPAAVREAYNYPATVAHRVIKINNDQGITFRTKGDNSGEDPFTVRPQDLLGRVSSHIPYLGFPLLFLQSQQGIAFSAVALILLALYLYATELQQGIKKAQRVVFAPIVGENERLSQSFAQRLESTERSAQLTQQALNGFAAAVAEYAKHLQSHTSAVQSLAEASRELKRGAIQQNEALALLLAKFEQTKPNMPEQPRMLQVERILLNEAVSAVMPDKQGRAGEPAANTGRPTPSPQTDLAPPSATRDVPPSLPPDSRHAETGNPSTMTFKVDLSDLFVTDAFEDHNTGKLAMGMDDVDAKDLLEQGLGLAGDLKKQKG